MAKKFVFLIPSLPLPLQRKWPLMPSGMAAWEHWHTCWRGGKEKGESVKYGATRHRKIERAVQRTKGKHLFPAAVTEVPRPSLSCGHGLRARVFSSGSICLQTVLPAIAPSGKSRARRFGGRKHVADGNGRRCRFTPVVSCIRRHSRLSREAKKGKNDKTVSAVQHKHIKEVSTTIAVSLVTLWSSWTFLCLCRF